MFWDGLFDHVSGLTGAPASQIKTITALLLSYPLASLYTRLPASRPNVSHIYSLAVSMFFLGPLLNLGTGILHLLLSCLGTYGLVITFRGSKMPWIVFAFTMGHLMYNHIINYIYGIPATEIEVTFTQMVMVMNLTTFAWNVHDGRQKGDDLDAGQLATRLLHVPSPLPFLGYCFFFPAFLIGPAFDYSTYDSLIKHTIFTTPPPGTNKEQVKATARRIPYGRKRVAYLHLVIGLVFLGLYAVYGARGAYSRILTPSWKGWSMLERFGFVQFAGVIARTKYYGVWSLTEGACILTGLGFNGYDPKTGRTLWNRVRNVNIVTLETAESFKVVFDSWNCRTNVWLRDCVYKRLTSRGKKPGTAQSMATFVTSAIWHGVEPGYYLAFVSAGLLTSLGRQLRRLVRPYSLPQATTEAPNSFPKYPYPNLYKRVYDVLGWSMVQINLNYVACAFMLLDLRSCLTAWHRMGWYGHIIIVLATVFFRGGGKGFLRNDLKKRGLEGGSKPKANGAAGVGEKQEVPGINISPASPPPQPDDETNPKDLKWVKHALDNPGYQDSGEGVHPDGGFVDRWLDGAETPAVDKADYKEL